MIYSFTYLFGLIVFFLAFGLLNHREGKKMFTANQALVLSSIWPITLLLGFIGNLYEFLVKVFDNISGNANKQ